MRALVIIHDPGSEPVLIGERLADHGFELHEVMITTEIGNPVGSADLGDPGDWDLLVPMGSNYSVYDTEQIGSWIGDELDFLRRADEHGVPMFGICFGAQALAASLGGLVVRSERAQIGWCPLVPENGTGLPPGPWLQWHYDRFEPPAEATVLAADEVGVQAFTIGRSLGVQFHPEVTRDHLARWVEMGGHEELTVQGIDPGQLLADAAAIEPDVRVRTNALVDWFLDEVAKF